MRKMPEEVILTGILRVLLALRQFKSLPEIVSFYVKVLLCRSMPDSSLLQNI